MMCNNRLICSAVLLLFLTGCSGLLPSIEQTTKSPWESFAEAKKSFDKIVPRKTSTEELKQLGFDPFETPNVTLITYLEIIKHFMPNPSITLAHLDPGVRACLKSRHACHGYAVAPKMETSRRYGNTAADLFNFRRKTMTTGWEFDALIVIKDELVVYKLWGGQPNIEKFEDKRNPLGPLQDVGKLLKF